MGIYVTGYTEARVDGKWVCIDFWQPDENGKYHHVPCIEGQSMVAQALEGVSVRLDGKTVGSLVAPAVGQAIAENVVSRRYGTE